MIGSEKSFVNRNALDKNRLCRYKAYLAANLKLKLFGMTEPTTTPILLSIAAVERDTGLSKDALRVWERRYGFPEPVRDQYGERAYPLPQVEKLRVIRRLMDQGYRPGKIVSLPLNELNQISANLGNKHNRQATLSPAALPATQSPTQNQDDLGVFMDLIRSHQVETLRRRLAESALRLGLARFVTAVAAPLAYQVGDNWARGNLEIFEEHLFTESLTITLRNAINTIPQTPQNTGRSGPKILLTTFPQETHGLGLLMAEAMFALEGAHCLSLGIQTPILDIVRAATIQHCEVIALSFSACLNANLVIDGLAELRHHLPKDIQIWAGGSCPVLHRRPPPDIIVLPTLESVSLAVAQWQQRPA